MWHRNFGSRRSTTERGATLLMVSAAMLFMMGMVGLGIDLASLYVGRTQAQRSADAAALAGAQAFVDSLYTQGAASAADAQALATQRALAVGNANLIAGGTPNISASDISFNFTNPQNPQITVVAARDAGHSNPMPTFFMKIFGIQSANVAATATAEAYAQTDVPVALSCVKPWLYPNCDFSKTDQLVFGGDIKTCSLAAPGNCNCPHLNWKGQLDGYYYPELVNDASGRVQFPGFYPTGSVGAYITLKPGDPSLSSTSSQFFAVVPPIGDLSCPACAYNNNGGSGSGGSGGSGSNYQFLIECCNKVSLVAGQTTTVQVNTGNMAGPTGSGVDCLINETKSNSSGQDTISWCSTFPNCTNAASPGYTIMAGVSNPLFPPGTPLSLGDSSNVVSIPIYDGHPLCSGSGSCSATNTIFVQGFLRVFLTGEDKSNQNTVSGYVLAVSGFGSSNSTTIDVGSPSPVPVRLIHP